MSKTNPIPFAKIVVVLAAAFGIGLGLCGLTFFTAAGGASHLGPNALNILPVLGVGGLIVMILSSIGLLITVIAWVVAAVIGNSRAKRGDE
jgi:hypothetical protein